MPTLGHGFHSESLVARSSSSSFFFLSQLALFCSSLCFRRRRFLRRGALIFARDLEVDILDVARGRLKLISPSNEFCVFLFLRRISEFIEYRNILVVAR